jgi:hypothetical protein
VQLRQGQNKRTRYENRDVLVFARQGFHDGEAKQILEERGKGGNSKRKKLNSHDSSYAEYLFGSLSLNAFEREAAADGDQGAAKVNHFVLLFVQFDSQVVG